MAKQKKKKSSKDKETSQNGTSSPETAPTGKPTPPAPQENNDSGDGENPFNLSGLISAMFSSLGPEAPKESSTERDKLIGEYLRSIISRDPLSEKYNILILHDEGRMIKSDADDIYSASVAFFDKRPIMLILYSTGGVIGSAYLIGKLCREYCGDKFVVVPRQAKSAATLLCCGADEIHMGSLSELGPIDPQIDDLPALGLKTSVEHIADLIKERPHATELFSKYLHLSLEPINLGYYERVAESAAQYAERLLNLHSNNLTQKPADIARNLVYSYKDHGFVIDKSEATEIFGENVVRTDTDEYRLGNKIYEALMVVSRLADVTGHYFYFVGSVNSEPHFQKRTRRQRL